MYISLVGDKKGETPILSQPKKISGWNKVCRQVLELTRTHSKYRLHTVKRLKGIVYGDGRAHRRRGIVQQQVFSVAGS